MAEIREINSSKYRSSVKISIDGNIWEVKPLSAGKSLKLSRAQKSMKTLQKKFDNDTITDDEIELMNSYEELMFNSMKDMFKDSTEDNSQVEAWFDETPLDVIAQVAEDIQKQADSKK